MTVPLYTILHRRIIRTPSANLSQHIISQARYLPQQQLSFWEQWKMMCHQEIAMSQPLLKFVSVLILGLMIGITSLSYLKTYPYSSISIFSLDAEEDLFVDTGDTYE